MNMWYSGPLKQPKNKQINNKTAYKTASILIRTNKQR